MNFVDYYTDIRMEAYEQGMAMNWIPCSERLPEEKEYMENYDPSDEVLVYIHYADKCVNNGCAVSRYWKSSKFHKDSPWIDLSDNQNNYVVAWMPLPKPYKIN